MTLFLALPDALQIGLAKCIPEHGSWKDVRSLMTKTEDVSPGLLDTLVKLYGAALNKDLQSAAASSTKLSLCAKYALRERVPAEKKILKRVFEEFKGLASEDAPFKVYRQKVSSLRDKLHVTETLMSSNKWDEIIPKEVPSECARRHKKAFLNVTKTGEMRSSLPEREDCRGNFLAAAEKKEIKSAVVDLPGLVSEALGARYATAAERKMLDAQAAAHVEHLKSTIKGNLGSILPIVDVSGSMTGIPMNVAIGMGLFASYVAHPAFAHRLMTFSADPEWIVVDPSQGWTNNVNTVSKAPWGFNTDLSKAVNMVMGCLRPARPPLQPEEVPRIVIFSDMQFDECCAAGPWTTQCDHIKAEFRNLGTELVGKEYDLHITFWNLRAGTKSYPTTSDTLGVSMLSGYSTNLLKAILMGDLSKTPLDVLLEILQDKNFDDVRNIASSILKD